MLWKVSQGLFSLLCCCLRSKYKHYWLLDETKSRDHSVYGLSQWKMPLQCNGISHWLKPYLEWNPRSGFCKHNLPVTMCNCHDYVYLYLNGNLQLWNQRTAFSDLHCIEELCICRRVYPTYLSKHTLKTCAKWMPLIIMPFVQHLINTWRLQHIMCW